MINLASVSGKRPLVRRTPYCASKMAVIGLTSTLAFEVGPSGVNVNSLSPGPVAGRGWTATSRSRPSAPAQLRRGRRRLRLPGRAGPDGDRGARSGAAVVAMLAMPGLCGADIDLSAGMVA